MALSRDQYNGAVAQLEAKIAQIDQQAKLVEEAKDNALLQKWVSQLFITLNDSSTEYAVVPVSKVAYCINDARAFFKFEALGEQEVTFTRHGDRVTSNPEVYWLASEHAEHLNSLTFDSEGKASKKMACFKASPAYLFNPKPVAVDVSTLAGNHIPTTQPVVHLPAPDAPGAAPGAAPIEGGSVVTA